MPQAHLPDGTILDFPEGIDPTIMDTAVKKHLAGSEIGMGEEFVRGVKRGAENTASLIKEGVPALTKGLLNKLETSMGFEPSFESQKNLEEYQKEIEDTFKKYPTKFESMKDIESLGGALHYASSAAGEMIPSMAMSLTGGGVGAVLAKQGVKALAKRAGTKVAEDALQKALIKGAAVGAVTASAPSNISETYMNLLEGGKDAPMTALAIGGLKTALDAYTPATLLGKVFGTKEASDLIAKNIFKRIGMEGMKAAPFEGLTEAAQEALDVYAETATGIQPEMFTADNAYRMMDAGLKGAIGGAFAGGAAAPLLTPTDEFKGYKPKTELPIEDITDATIMTPAYVSNEDIQSAKDLGVDVESLAQVSPKDIEGTKASISQVDTGKTSKIRTTPETMDPAVLESVTTRQQALRHPTAPAQDFGSFVLGDGMITAGTQVDPTSSVLKAEEQIKTVNPKKITAKANSVKQAKMKVPSVAAELPFKLSNIPPKYKGAHLAFPSDLEQALYFSTQASMLSEKGLYRKWLKQEHGFTDAQINKYSNDVKQSVVKAHAVLPSAEVVDVPVFTPELPTAKTQKDMVMPFHGNLQQDYVIPMQIAQNLWATSLTEDAKTQTKALTELAMRNIKEIAGPVVKTEFFKNLATTKDFANDPIKGAQFQATIAIALDGVASPAALTETSYHEAIHFLWDTAFSKQQKKILTNNIEALKAYALKDGHLSTVDFDTFKLTPLGQEELVTNALAKMLVEYRQDNKNIKSFPSAFHAAFYKIKNFLQRLANGLRGLGFQSFDDIFKSVEAGKMAREHLDEALALNALARYQRLTQDLRQVFDDIKMQPQTFNEMSAEAVREANKPMQETGKGISIFTRYCASLSHLASKDPFAKLIYDTLSRKLNNGQKLLNTYAQMQKDFAALPKDTRYHIHTLADEMRNTKQKAILDADGYLVFQRDQKRFRITDKDIASNYMQLQKVYGQVLTDWQEELIRNGAKTFKKYLPVGRDLTKEDFRNALTAISPATQETLHVQLTNFVEALDAVDTFRAFDFSPKMRFGSHGIAVKDDAGNTVAFYTIERGSFRNLYNKYQLDEAVKTIQTKYGDASKFTVYDANGKVKNINADKVVPFTMTHAKEKNMINPKFVSLEALSSLLFSQGMDQEAYKAMRDQLYTDILKRGFENRFAESKNIDGYSTDWDRVHHAYLSGAAHFLSGLPAQEEISTLLIDANKLADEHGLRKKMLNHLEYVNSPQEDWQSVRALNFIWTMGGNVSSALMQIFTLPTTTLGVMTQYNPNLIQNMKYIGKWTKIGAEFIKEATKEISLENGGMAVDFGDAAILDRLEKRGIIDKEQRSFMEKVNVFGRWRGMETATSTGYKPFETRSLGGGIKAKASNMAQLLGLPINAMEQMTRFGTTMASFEMLQKNKSARERMRKVMATDYRFQAQLKTNKDFNFAENGALFNMDEAHGVFGKLARVEYQRGIGGALFFPFMTYPHQMLELLARMYGRGEDGKRALATTLTAMLLLGGLMGLPGAELIKELLEALQKNITGIEYDYDLLMRETIYNATGSETAAKAVTQGIGRAFLGMDISKRIGLGVPGQELLLSFLGIRSQPSAMLGVQGSIIDGAIQAWQEYNQGGGVSSLFQAVTPIAASNVIKAARFTQEGATTKAGLQIVTPEQMSSWSVMARALGITSDQIATGREALYYSQLTQRKYQVGVDRFKKQAQTAMTNMIRAQREGDSDEAKDYYEKYQEILKDFADYNAKNNIQQNFASFNRSIMTGAQQRVSGGVNLTEVKKSSRVTVKEILDVLGVKE